ncbi:hypothetical protein [Polluticoccus soli]|uniref:hypothetical protein n=1 Tax=Polluticoccus soli TaxID=3034150 RepID=UPI0023E2E4F2|nr:hypothetical protein [Flavipsychrobacter sp. JY13-12]
METSTAYIQAYPKAKKECAYTAAIRLARQLHIKERIAAAMVQHAQQEHQRAQEREEHKRRMAEEDTLQKRIWLARVVRGQVMKQRYMQFRGRTILVHETLNPFIILRAIELDTRYEYGTNPKSILDRQFARLYERAMRPVGLALINRTSPRCSRAVTAPFQGGMGITGKNTQNASKKLTTERSELVRTAKKDIKKRTNSKRIMRPAMHVASNIPVVCNNIKGRPVCTSAAVMHRAETHVVILSEVECSSPSAVILSEVESSETQRRICLIGDTATSRQILRCAQNDSLDCATSDTTASEQILRCAQNDSLDGNEGLDGTTSDTAESRQITFGERVLRCAQNDSFGGRSENGISSMA